MGSGAGEPGASSASEEGEELGAGEPGAGGGGTGGGVPGWAVAGAGVGGLAVRGARSARCRLTGRVRAPAASATA